MINTRRITLVRRPAGLPRPEDFALQEVQVGRPGANQILLRNYYCSMDPAMRLWMNETSYSASIPLDQVLRCAAVAKVVESGSDEYHAGDYVIAMAGAEDYSLITPDEFTIRIAPGDEEPLHRFLNLYGLTGLTAYFGMTDVGRPVKGDSVLVSSAAGGVGSIAAQIARINGCRVVGIAGSKAKREYLTSVLGLDDAIDYRGKSTNELTFAIRQACPEGVDVYFDNVGGKALDAALANINVGGRIACCGMIAQYNAADNGGGIGNIWQIVAKSAKMQGFLGRQYLHRFDEAIAQLRVWYESGEIVTREHVESGLENFYTAYLKLFDGSNEGKLILKIRQDR